MADRSCPRNWIRRRLTLNRFFLGGLCRRIRYFQSLLRRRFSHRNPTFAPLCTTYGGGDGQGRTCAHKKTITKAFRREKESLPNPSPHLSCAPSESWRAERGGRATELAEEGRRVRITGLLETLLSQHGNYTRSFSFYIRGGTKLGAGDGDGDRRERRRSSSSLAPSPLPPPPVPSSSPNFPSIADIN